MSQGKFSEARVRVHTRFFMEKLNWRKGGNRTRFAQKISINKSFCHIFSVYCY